MIGRAAEVAQPLLIQCTVLDAGETALVERLGLGLEIEAAAFQDGDLDAAAHEMVSDGHAGGTGPDDAEVGFNLRPAWQLM